MTQTIKNLILTAFQLLQELRPLLLAVITPLLKQAEPRLLKLFIRDLDSSDGLANHHLLHQGIEQIESVEQSPTLSTDCTPQLWNNRPAIHMPKATAGH